ARRVSRPGFPRMAQQAAGLIVAAILLALPAASFAFDPNVPPTPWASLSPQEQRILGPIAPDWNKMPGYQQQRLIASARRYPQMQPIQKERFEDRIRTWSSMTPDQRKAARETFQGLRKLPPEKQHELRERWLAEHNARPGAPPRPAQPHSPGT